MRFQRTVVPVADTSRQQSRPLSVEELHHRLVQFRRLMHSATGEGLRSLKAQYEREVVRLREAKFAGR